LTAETFQEGPAGKKEPKAVELDNSETSSPAKESSSETEEPKSVSSGVDNRAFDHSEP